jgi:hypothetical protein
MFGYRLGGLDDARFTISFQVSVIGEDQLKEFGQCDLNCIGILANRTDFLNRALAMSPVLLNDTEVVGRGKARVGCRTK